MKNKLFYLFFLFLIAGAACQKTEIYQEEIKEDLLFSNLISQKKLFKTKDTIWIKAIATGETLVYNWLNSGGSILGTGDSVLFSAESIDNYSIKCTITDKYGNTQEKSLDIATAEGMTFLGIMASDTITHITDTIELSALVTGDELKYLWNVQNGKIIGEGEKVKFVAQTEGEISINCKITDNLETTIEKNLTITLKNFIFKGLIAEKQTVTPNKLLKINDIAYGTDLKYKWTSEGVIIGEGAEVNFTVCHREKFVTKCEISDNKGNIEEKEIIISVK